MTSPHDPHARSGLGAAGAALLFGAAVVGAMAFLRPAGALSTSPFERVADEAGPAKSELAASPSAAAFGRSGNVLVRFALPNQMVEFPLSLGDRADSLSYQWVPVGDSTSSDVLRPLAAGMQMAPPRPGFYRMAVVRGTVRELIQTPTLAVMVPFDHKMGGSMNGYRIGTYLAERFGKRDGERPDGFVEVGPMHLDLPLTKHLAVADFVTRDDQGDVWPKYVALNPRLLDKLELVFADLGAGSRPNFSVTVNSGFRTPAHNARVARAAGDSRHQYGDAADVVIDADEDGRFTLTDELLVMLAVERVEEKHPDLVGGMGMYTSRRWAVPYTHIDARGKRSRWKG